MWRVLRNHWRWGVGVSCVLALAGCAGHYLVQRDPWRKEAEIACLKSGAVRESGTIVRIEPINGPGMCGADFPMKVAALGDSPMLSYSGDLRPPGNVPNAGARNAGAQRWPVTSEPSYTPPPSSRQVMPGEQQYSNPMRPAPVPANLSIVRRQFIEWQCADADHAAIVGRRLYRSRRVP
jgi:hypothetical protein